MAWDSLVDFRTAPVPRIVDGEPTRTENYAGTDFGTFEYDGLNAECWAWPFPEAATTGEFLKITGSSRAGMGTAPAIWNTVLRLMVAVVPRAWWSSRRFSEGLARFSEPLVRVTDAFVGEAHAMRVDVSSATSGAAVAAVHLETARFATSTLLVSGVQLSFTVLATLTSSTSVGVVGTCKVVPQWLMAFVANGTSLSPQHLAAHHLQHLVGVVLVTLSALLWAYSGGAHARRDTAARVLAEVFDAATPPGSPSRAPAPHSPTTVK